MEAETLPSDRIQRAIEELELQKALITNCAIQWKTLSDHYSSLKKTLAERAESLDSKLDALESETKQALDSIERRESSLPERESSAAGFIAERRDSVVDEMESQEDKLPGDLQGFLSWYCRRMDSAALWRFMVSRRKELAALRREISGAVAQSLDPPRLVLDAIEDFLSQPDAIVAGGGCERCWAVGMLVWSLLESEGRKASQVASSIRERAASVAKSWLAKHEEKKGNGDIEEGGTGEGGKEETESPEGRTFLQMVVAFGLRSMFEDEFLIKMVVQNASRKEVAKLAVGLEFGEKMEVSCFDTELYDIINNLVKKGKEIEAFYFVHESGLTEKFSPIDLLKSYLQNSRKNASAILKNRNHSMAAAEESNNLEMNALKSITKCVEIYKLEDKFGLGSIRKRLSQLEKAKSERKKSQASQKPQIKRPPPTRGTPSFPPSKAIRIPHMPSATYSRNPSLGPQNPPASRQPFNYVGQATYDSHPSVPYGAPPSHGRSSSMTPSYNTYYGGVPYGGQPINYGAYEYPPPPPQPHYQP
ncbi:Protein FRIGIDA [Apostasia shenzhenica]|uniref:FRIGIDA-like protein n=1 Tax=Apostasia shenzhenica TaxID=1088818 RepID=A0A2I0AE35_9ASPA|nr:Protein FRIGIDA [Apostasia shenzhenica]